MNTINIKEKGIKCTNARLFAVRNSENNERVVFTEKDFRVQFETNEEGVSYVKNKTFKSAPIWEELDDRFIATTENYYYVLFYKKENND